MTPWRSRILRQGVFGETKGDPPSDSMEGGSPQPGISGPKMLASTIKDWKTYIPNTYIWDLYMGPIYGTYIWDLLGDLVVIGREMP